MNFIAHDLWSLVWLGALVLASVFTIAGGKGNSLKLIAVMWCNWIATRLIVNFDKSNDMVWLALEFLTVIAVLSVDNSKSGKSIAACFALILTMNLVQVLGFSEFSQTAAVADALGFVILIIICGVGHAGPNDGKLARFIGGLSNGTNRDLVVVESRGKDE